MTTTTPLPPAPPHCTRKATGRKVRRGRLKLVASCDHAVAARITGGPTVKHGKRTTQVTLHALSVSLPAATDPLSLKLPRAALRAMRHHRRASLVLKLVATDAGGTTTSTLRLSGLTTV